MKIEEGVWIEKLIKSELSVSRGTLKGVEVFRERKYDLTGFTWNIQINLQAYVSGI